MEYLEADENENSQQLVGNTESQSSKLDLGLLIEAVQGYPYLFDLSHKLYKDTKKKTQAWQLIAEILHCSVEDCIKAWKNLRDRFVKEKNKLASGAEAPETNWAFYEPMLFYGRFTKSRKTHTSTIKNIQGSRPSSRESVDSRPSSSASVFSNMTYDIIMSPEITAAESQAVPSEEGDEAPVPSKISEISHSSGRKSQSVTQTPTTSSENCGKKRKRLELAESDDICGIMSVAKNIAAQLETRVPRNANSTFVDYIFQELEKLPEDRAKMKRKKF